VKQFLLICLVAAIAMTVNAQTNLPVFQSSERQTALLELYTSEGCNSCPPAEEWLSGLKESPGLWKDFVPVAFHVDYWDLLGWRDPWGAKQFSDRQRAYADSWHNDSVYTPGFVLNGKEWRDWSRQTNGPSVSGAAAGNLKVSATGGNHWQAVFVPAKPGAARYELHAALLAGGLSSDVTAGENKGRRLTHDFIVLTLVKSPLTLHGGEARGEFKLEPPRKTMTGRPGIAVWVTQTGRLEPLQATGGWLTPGGS
jgi:hypothetical protein